MQFDHKLNSIEDAKKISFSKCIYAVFDKSLCLYVGATESKERLMRFFKLPRRFSDSIYVYGVIAACIKFNRKLHIKIKDFKGSKEELIALEQEAIKSLTPLLNIFGAKYK